MDILTAKKSAHRLCEKVLKGERLAVARAISWVEDGYPAARPLIEMLSPYLGKAYRVGITGPPGAGKSTLVDALAREARSHGETVGVVAVDPTSPFSGGAFLGDRVRMARALEDKEVFVRSMASRGSSGGLSRAAQEALDILDAMGKTLLLLETVGVGQSELAVAGACDCTIVVLVPEAGGVIQAMKAGLMEIADLFVVNKADRPGVDDIHRALEEAAEFLAKDGWLPPVIDTVALESKGVSVLYDKIMQLWSWLQEEGRLEKKRLSQSASRIRELVRCGLEERLWCHPEVVRVVEEYALAFYRGDMGLYRAAERVWEQIRVLLSPASLGFLGEDSEYA